ncbi:helix-turn-helix transcriptional regulator [Veillonella sp.]|uniref:helix-turn-helix domain-containing protein n=1 Tax=Veillonella sp. TaxID=1926307 RepID=UPI0025E2FE4E|nr:helix-turn-helix transcriptional regulator [Veillonella sp.]
MDTDIDTKKRAVIKQIGARIAYYRTLRGLTQDELAKRASISPGALGRIERGKYNDNVSIAMLVHIATGLQIEISMLLNLNEKDQQICLESIQN